MNENFHIYSMAYNPGVGNRLKNTNRRWFYLHFGYLNRSDFERNSNTQARLRSIIMESACHIDVIDPIW